MTLATLATCLGWFLIGVIAVTLAVATFLLGWFLFNFCYEAIRTKRNLRCLAKQCKRNRLKAVETAYSILKAEKFCDADRLKYVKQTIDKAKENNK